MVERVENRNGFNRISALSDKASTEYETSYIILGGRGKSVFVFNTDF